MTFEARRFGTTSITRGLLRCGVVAGPAFITVFLIEGARRANYHPLRHPVSALSLGHRGGAQMASFGVAGALYVAGAAGLFRAADATTGSRSGSVLIGAAGVGLLGSGVFHTEPVSGYPPESLEAATDPSASMTRHGIASIPIVVGLPVSALAYSWRFHRSGKRRWALYSAATAVSMVANFALAAAGFGQAPRLVHLAGLFQRASIITAFTWVTAVSARALNHSEPAGGKHLRAVPG
jgi:hypothetical protein